MEPDEIRVLHALGLRCAADGAWERRNDRGELSALLRKASVGGADRYSVRVVLDGAILHPETYESFGAAVDRLRALDDPKAKARSSSNTTPPTDAAPDEAAPTVLEALRTKPEPRGRDAGARAAQKPTIVSIFRDSFQLSGKFTRYEFMGLVAMWIVASGIFFSLGMAALERLHFRDLDEGAIATAATVAWCFAQAVSMLIAGIRRLRDLGRSPWLIVLVFVPFVNALMMVWLLFAAGTPEASNARHR